MHPRFHGQFMDIEVRYCQTMVRMDVHDLTGHGAPIIGTAEVPLGRFAIPGGAQEWIEIFFHGRPAGRLHFRSEFVNGGMGVAIVNPGMGMQQPMGMGY